MLKLTSIKSEKIWGYENWIASTHPNGMQKDLFDFYGGDFPLLVKVIQADETLSVQIHPDDETAQKMEGCRGKTECWLVLDAKPDAKMVYGLNKDYTKEEMQSLIAQNKIEETLRYVSVQKGDFLFIPSGTVHAIGGGIRLLEVQQSSDITYRFWDWGRPREIHVQKALECIKNFKDQNVVKFDKEFSCQYFNMKKIAVETECNIALEKFTLAFVLEGEGLLNGQKIAAEDICAFKAGESINASGNIKLMLISE